MKVLGVNMRPVRKHEIKDILSSKFNIKDQKVIEGISEGRNFMLNNDFLFGHVNDKTQENTVLVYMTRDETKETDGIYVRKKLRILKHYMDKSLKGKKIISLVDTDNFKAQKFNNILFPFHCIVMDTFNNTYHAYKNYVGEI